MDFVFLFLIPALIAALSGMGMGGGGLMAVYLQIMGSESQLALQSFNLLFFLFSSGAALCVHLPRRQIYGGAVLVMIVFGIFGTLLGSSLALVLDGAILKRIFGGMLLASGIFALVSSFLKERPKIAGYDQ